MSKIICDVCGTSYPASSSQCPICGCVRPADNIQVDAEQETPVFERSENYTYVKGGRFSKANVQKRNQGIAMDPVMQDAPSEKEKNPKSDRGLVIAVCVLLLAIVAVVIYIAMHFFAPSQDEIPMAPETTGNVSSQATDTVTTEPSTEQLLSCEEIVLSNTEITFDSAGAVYQLNVVLTPEDTTDILSFSSQDENVATVSETGEVVAVSSGETVITVTCGTVTAQCKVICNFSVENVEETTAPTVSNETYRAPYKINKKDVTIRVGETFVLKLIDADGKIIPVTWSPTDLETCTIDGNNITGAAKGKTDISVVYEGETYVCVVRVV